MSDEITDNGKTENGKTAYCYCTCENWRARSGSYDIFPNYKLMELAYDLGWIVCPWCSELLKNCSRSLGRDLEPARKPR